ncbi:MAG: diguanylate phosphodiesterase [Acidimicrobiales bacterium]|nr:diguanylate phosphodiesterase [Acidimicrobiales bacterium]
MYIGRQPILDRQRHRRGYELLFRNGVVTDAVFEDGDAATRLVVEQALLDWGLRTLVGDGDAFVNVTAEFLHSGLFTVLPPERVVLEVLESVALDCETVAAVKAATALGYRFALDDVVSTSVVGLEHILPFVDVIKIEVLSLSDASIRDLVTELRLAAPKARLLAEKVETRASFEFCRDLGFDLFQGYFFAKPEVLQRAARPLGSDAAMALLAAVQDPSITIDHLADLASTDPTLTYRLLKLVNTSAAGLVTPTDSVKQAIVLLGIDYVRQIATLLTLSTNSTSNPELVTLAVTRAHMARHLLAGQGDANAAFTAGLLSVIDVVFGVAMVELVDELPLSGEVRDALLLGEGPIGHALEFIRAYEQADVATMSRYDMFDAELSTDAFGRSTAHAIEFDRQLAVLTGSRRRRARTAHDAGSRVIAPISS